MLRLLMTILVAVVAVSAVTVGTFAAFSDAESDSSSITAGTILLTVGSFSSDTADCTVTLQAPGDSGTCDASVSNDGSLAGELFALISVNNTEGTDAEFQTGGSGDLGAAITTSAETVGASGSPAATLVDIDTVAGGLQTWDTQWALASTFNGLAITELSTCTQVASMAAGSSITPNFDWSLPTSTDNTAQGDSVVLTISYKLEQAGTTSSDCS